MNQYYRATLKVEVEDKNGKPKMRKDTYIVEVEGDRFLYRMVRNVVGSLVEIGRGRFRPSDMKRVLNMKDRRFAGPCAPASGLILCKVMYN